MTGAKEEIRWWSTWVDVKHHHPLFSNLVPVYRHLTGRSRRHLSCKSCTLLQFRILQMQFLGDTFGAGVCKHFCYMPGCLSHIVPAVLICVCVCWCVCCQWALWGLYPHLIWLWRADRIIRLFCRTINNKLLQPPCLCDRTVPSETNCNPEDQTPKCFLVLSLSCFAPPTHPQRCS